MTLVEDDNARILVVIVNYRKSADVLHSVQLLEQQSIANQLNIVVIDNSECKEEWTALSKIHSRVRLFRARRNLGYTRAVNFGLRLAGGGHVLLVSPDVQARDRGAVEVLLKTLRDEVMIGVLAPIQENPDGSFTEVGRKFPTVVGLLRRRLLSRYRHSDLTLVDRLQRSESDVARVDWVQSSFVLIRSELIARGLELNRSFFIFMADIWLGHEVRSNFNREVMLTKRVTVYGDGKRASEGGLIRFVKSRAGRAHLRDAAAYFVLRSSLTRRESEGVGNRTQVNTRTRSIKRTK